ncbi:agmatinase family protein [Arachidicoccus terrestris]|uniref:agmatinase family protein n=1 Tax=Arachidicoccus terrestris TaxID=2875539 RepID=UPI001CC614B1|nr:agmatinase family protein [Arachidicoccus terrestris]UAY54700.1 agmatinase family protein [Arachidicoccus terrestris]
MVDLSNFDPNSVGNPENGLFGLPFNNVEDSGLVILPVPWEVTVSYGSGAARAIEPILKASLQIDLFDPDYGNTWQKGFFMMDLDKKILTKSDYLRKEAELFVDYICHGDEVGKNNFMCKSIRDINEGGIYLNTWVYERAKNLISKGKLVGLLGGDHSTPYGYIKALAETHESFGILQIDAHCDLRSAYEGFTYSHASIMYNVLEDIPQVNKLVQIGIRDFCEQEWDYIQQHPDRVKTFFDRQIKERMYEGESWQSLVDEIVAQLPDKVYLSFDIDGLDPKLCPNTGTPVQGGFEACQIIYLIKKIVASGRRLIGFDLVEVGSNNEVADANVGARMLWHLCNWLTISNNK